MLYKRTDDLSHLFEDVVSRANKTTEKEEMEEDDNVSDLSPQAQVFLPCLLGMIKQQSSE